MSIIYYHLDSTFGWILICVIWAGSLAVPLAFDVLFTGAQPLVKRLGEKMRGRPKKDVETL